MLNFLIVSRIVFILFLGYMVIYGYFEIVFGLFVVVGIIDFVSILYLDGWKYW